MRLADSEYFRRVFRPSGRAGRPSSAADHSCCVCPVEVRDLLATAHNALGAYERGDDPARLRRKMAELRESHDRLSGVSRGHFQALGYRETDRS